jgi:hypothetical protein
VTGYCDLHLVSKSDEGSNDEERGRPRKKKELRKYIQSCEKVYPWLYIWTKAGMELFASCVSDMHLDDLVILRPNKKLNVVRVFDKLVTDCNEM